MVDTQLSLRRKSAERAIEIERGTLTPLEFSSAGGAGNEALNFIKRLASLESKKTCVAYTETIRNLRTEINF